MRSLRTVFLAALLLSPFILGCFAAQPKPKGLLLDIEYEAYQIAKRDPKDTSPEPFEYTFYVLITNSTDVKVTVPSSSYDGTPCCWMSGMYEKGVSYAVGRRSIGDHVVVDSPARYIPVTLRPGESTQFATYKLTSEVALKLFRVTIDIDEEYAAEQKWWGGSIRGECDLTIKKRLR